MASPVATMGAWTFSYSGADCRVWGWFPQAQQEKLGADITRIKSAIDILLRSIKELEKERELVRKGLAASVKARKPIVLNMPGSSNLAQKLVKITPEFYEKEEGLKHIQEKLIPAVLKPFNDEIAKLEIQISDLRTLTVHLGSLNFVPLTGLQTLSISVHEPKGMVRRLGHASVVGYTRSVRTIAGSMIFTVLNSHPLEGLMFADPHQHNSLGDADFPYTRDADHGWGTLSLDGTAGTQGVSGTSFYRPAARLSPFSLIIYYVSEYGNKQFMETGGELENAGAGMQLEDIEIISTGMVTSVHDMVTEITYNFVARDMTELSEFTSRMTRSRAIASIKKLKDLYFNSGLLEEIEEDAWQEYAKEMKKASEAKVGGDADATAVVGEKDMDDAAIAAAAEVASDPDEGAIDDSLPDLTVQNDPKNFKFFTELAKSLDGSGNMEHTWFYYKRDKVTGRPLRDKKYRCRTENIDTGFSPCRPQHKPSLA